MAWDDRLCLFYAYVYFLKWSAIIFTIKGSYKSSDSSEKHSQLRASGGPALVLPQRRISVGSLLQSDEASPFGGKGTVFSKMEPVLRIPRAGIGRNWTPSHGSSRGQRLAPLISPPPPKGYLEGVYLPWCFSP